MILFLKLFYIMSKLINFSTDRLCTFEFGGARKLGIKTKNTFLRLCHTLDSRSKKIQLAVADVEDPTNIQEIPLGISPEDLKKKGLSKIQIDVVLALRPSPSEV